MASEDKCPRCGAAANMPSETRGEGRSATDWLCGSQTMSWGVWEAEDCKDRQIAQLRRALERLYELYVALCQRLGGPPHDLETFTREAREGLDKEAADGS